ncbi:alpha/beta hydrolase [Verrucomicrobium spinosum]|uniref:alpha/beta hydrolase n=1 Tax=Verrucomicrobium spinosum TaxID=2736 RepID=UPI0009EA9DB8|nr:alpha/beta hydrolase [Verrucomicrobium spinosum]
MIRPYRLPFAAALLGLLLAGASCLVAEEPTVTARLNLPYKESSATLTDYETTRCKLDLYTPAGPRAPLPVIVWFHGGGITAGDKGSKDTTAVVTRMAQDGFLVASVNYRLSPKATYPAYLEDAAAAVAWVLKNAADHGGDPKKVFVAGHSAGGYLTTMLALDERYLGKHNLKPGDLCGYIPVAGQMITHAAVRAERGIAKTTMIVDEAAPLYHVRSDIPPCSSSMRRRTCFCGLKKTASLPRLSPPQAARTSRSGRWTATTTAAWATAWPTPTTLAAP